MTLPPKVVGLLGVMQALLVTYSVLAVNFFLAVKPGENPLVIEAFRRYGVLLFLVPLVWAAASAYCLGKQEPSRHAASVAFWSGLTIITLLLMTDVVVTIHIISRSGMLKV
jgi:hypothetical protein